MNLSFGPQQINVCLNGSQFWTTSYNVCSNRYSKAWWNIYIRNKRQSHKINIPLISRNRCLRNLSSLYARPFISQTTVNGNLSQTSRTCPFLHYHSIYAYISGHDTLPIVIPVASTLPIVIPVASSQSSTDSNSS